MHLFVNFIAKNIIDDFLKNEKCLTSKHINKSKRAVLILLLLNECLTFNFGYIHLTKDRFI